MFLRCGLRLVYRRRRGILRYMGGQGSGKRKVPAKQRLVGIGVRLTPEEYELLKQAAIGDEPVSVTLRRLALGCLESENKETEK